jgi:hypothetical protein
VIAWEPVPQFAAFFQYGLLRNNLTAAVELRGAVVGESHGEELEMVVPSTGIWGTAGEGQTRPNACVRAVWQAHTRSKHRNPACIAALLLLPGPVALSQELRGVAPWVLQAWAARTWTPPSAWRPPSASSRRRSAWTVWCRRKTCCS